MIFAGELPIDLVVFLAIIFLISVAVEAVTEIITSSELTEPLRKKWKEWTYPLDGPPPDNFTQKAKVWFDKLISCGYCTSVWVGGFFGIWAPKYGTGSWLIDWLLITFVLHRIATWLHVVYELVRKGRVRTYDLEVKMQDSEEYDGSVGEGTTEESAEVESGGDEAGGGGDSQ
jgi:hypothetical protein